MIRFNCDYNEGAHVRILQKLMETNMEQTIGYGVDEHCKHAAELIKKECNATSFSPSKNIDFGCVFSSIGTPVKIVKLFGGLEGYKQAIFELEQQLYSA